MVWQTQAVHSTVGQFCRPTQVFKASEFWRAVSEGGKKCGSLQQQLHLHIPWPHPLLHVRCTISQIWNVFFSSVIKKMNKRSSSSSKIFRKKMDWNQHILIKHGALNNSCLMLVFLLFSISSPMLLIALAVFAGAFYIIHLKSLESKLVVLGE